jgi:outer membrane murein-binding lipoprotein Lpp
MHSEEQINLVTDNKLNHSTPISRRQALKLAISSVLLVAGCTSMSSSSDLDTAVSELNELLNDATMDNDRTLLSSIASKIESRASELVAEHKAFIDNFDQLLSNYETTEAQLEQTAKTYATRRRQLRDDLLHLQDELHTAMTPDEWDKVVQVLNQTGQAIAAYTLSEG